MSTPEGFAERMIGQPQISQATIDELLEVFGEDQVDEMAAHGQLDAQQLKDWKALQPTPPAFGPAVPHDA